MTGNFGKRLYMKAASAHQIRYFFSSKSADGEIHYFNFVTGDSVWDHPCDDYYKNLYGSAKKKKDEWRAIVTAAVKG